MPNSHEEQNMEIIRRWNEDGWNGRNIDVAWDVISPNMQVHGAGGQQVNMGPEGLIQLITTWRNAFPDGHMTIDDLFAEGDTVVIRNTWRGTQTGEFYGIPPSGKLVEISSIGIDRVVDGKVVEGWGELNMLGAMQQMGALPPFGQAVQEHHHGRRTVHAHGHRHWRDPHRGSGKSTE